MTLHLGNWPETKRHCAEFEFFSKNNNKRNRYRIKVSGSEETRDERQDRPTRFDCKCVNFYGRDCPLPLSPSPSPYPAPDDVYSELFYMAEGRWKSLRKMNDSLTSSALLCSGYTLYCMPDGAFTALPVTSGVKSRCPISISIPIRLQLRNCNKRQHEIVCLLF